MLHSTGKADENQSPGQLFRTCHCAAIMFDGALLRLAASGVTRFVQNRWLGIRGAERVVPVDRGSQPTRRAVLVAVGAASSN